MENEERNSKKRHEMRKKLKLLKLHNMKLKKQLRLSLRVRFLNRLRLEGEIQQLNTLLLRMRTSAVGEEEQSSADVEKNFTNPESTHLFEQNNEKHNLTKTEKSVIYTLPVKKSNADYKFFCDRCEFKCKKKTPFDIHLRRHQGLRPYTCEECDKTFVAKYELKLHSVKHAQNQTYGCDQCDYTTYHSEMLVNHKEKHSGFKDYRCDICAFRTSERSKMISHRRSHLPSEASKCAACEVSNKYKSSNVTNCNETNALDNTTAVSSHGEKENYSNSTSDRHRIALGDREISSHINRITLDPPKTLSDTGRMVLDTSKMNYDDRGITSDIEAMVIDDQSVRIGSSKLYSVNNVENLSKGTILRHTCGRIWTCDVCGLSFKRRESLTKHLRTHSGERLFKCDSCNYAAATKHTLVIHIRKHSGEKPYRCSQCPFRCSTSGYLKIHINNHNGVRPYACHLCPYRSVDSCKLSAHKRSRHGIHKQGGSSATRTSASTETERRKLICKHCARTFSTMTALTEHEGEHTGEQPFSCEECSPAKRFSTESMLRRHVSRSHGSRMSCRTCEYTSSVGRDMRRHQLMHTREGGKTCQVCNYRCVKATVFIKHMQKYHPEIPFDPIAFLHQMNTIKDPAITRNLDESSSNRITQEANAVQTNDAETNSNETTTGSSLCVVGKHSGLSINDAGTNMSTQDSERGLIFRNNTLQRFANSYSEPTSNVGKATNMSMHILERIPSVFPSAEQMSLYPSNTIDKSSQDGVMTMPQIYLSNPMILNIPNAQNLLPKLRNDLVQNNLSVANNQQTVGNQTLTGYSQQATLMPTLNFYWTQ